MIVYLVVKNGDSDFTGNRAGVLQPSGSFSYGVKCEKIQSLKIYRTGGEDG